MLGQSGNEGFIDEKMAECDLHGIETIGDIIDYACEKIVRKGNGSVEAILGYGNTFYAYEPEKRLEDISQKEFDEEVKPDFLVFVNDPNKFYKDEKNCKELVEFNREAPCYFNINEGGVKWKTGVYTIELVQDMTKEGDKETLWLEGRMQKPFKEIYVVSGAEEFIDDVRDRVKRNGLEMALERLRSFNYDKLILNIIRTNYLAEAWRFDFWFKPKSLFKDIKGGMKEEYLPYLKEAVSDGRVYRKEGFQEEITLENVDDFVFYNKEYSIKGRLGSWKDLAGYNWPSFKLAKKQTRTNDNSKAYVFRKIKKIFVNMIPSNK
ncbi:phosphatidate cytidylyltransferase [Candidatus Woesearchaeota archaeon]|nr:phosphatidate cytidylyltransferase [Candidatus Woesearchaeota archaeon]